MEDYFDTDYSSAADHFLVEELLDFSNHDDVTAAVDVPFNGDSTESSAVTTVESSNSSSFSSSEPNSFLDATFSGELCVPYDDLAELEWLSNFTEESFSSEDLQNLELISGVKVKSAAQTQNAAVFNPNTLPVPAKARSKRSRAGLCNWNNSRLLSPTTSETGPPNSGKNPPAKKKHSPDPGGASAGEARKCVHCATDKTPQWRTGPMGPKTLCNACGVRFKSGRLVPEYRPAASPTFVLTKHSNSHRKVVELRRQKERVRADQLLLDHRQINMMMDESNGEDFLIHHHVGPDFRHMI